VVSLCAFLFLLVFLCGKCFNPAISPQKPSSKGVALFMDCAPFSPPLCCLSRTVGGVIIVAATVAFSSSNLSLLSPLSLLLVEEEEKEDSSAAALPGEGARGDPFLAGFVFLSSEMSSLLLLLSGFVSASE